MNKNKTKKIFFILALISSLLFFVGCEKEDTTGPEEVILDGVDVLVINLWDKYELQQDGENLIPVLLGETALEIKKHDMIVNGTSVKPEDQEIYFEGNQIYITDGDVNTYLYDYYYNVSSKALWLKNETTDTNTIVDSLGAAVSPFEIEGINLEELSLYYVSGQGPILSLIEPGEGYYINELDPLFSWNLYVAATSYNIVCALDAEFNNVVFEDNNTDIGTAKVEYQVEFDLENFTEYFWKVKANNSAWTETWSFTTNYVVTLLKPQNGFSASAKPKLDWKELDGANEYYLQVSESGDFDNLLYEETLTETEFNITEMLDFETTYFWRVKTDTSGENWSEIWMFNTDVVIVLGYPGDDASEVTVPVAFEWGALDNADTYHVQVATDEDFADIVLNQEFLAVDYPNTWTEPGLLTANLDGYYWRMTSDVALPVDGDDNWSNAYPFLTNDGVILNTPENENVEGVIVKFDWEEYPYATEYTIEVALDNSFTSVVLTDVITELETGSNPPVVSEYLSEMDFELASEYFWRVKDVNSNWSEVRSFTTITEYLAETVGLLFPANTTDEDLAKQIPELSWDRLGSSEYYRVQISQQSDFSTILLENVGDARAFTPETEDALDYNGVYYWRVRSEKSLWCDPWGFRVKSGVPTAAEFVSVGQFANKVELTWDDRTYFETGFEIVRSDTENGDYLLIGTSDADYNNFTDYNLDENTTFWYKGRTLSDADTSAYWSPISVSTSTFNLVNNPEMITLPAGSFSMGSTDGDADEAPVHDVTLSNDFMMGKTEITNSEYAEVINWALGKGLISIGSYVDYEDGYGLADNEEEEDFFIKEDGVCMVQYSNTNKMFEVEAGYDDYPVNDITWYGAALYANSLSEINGLTPVYEYWNNSCNIDVISANGYRLPTEAEWEYTAKYNDGRVYPWGNDAPTHALANFYNTETTDNGIAAVGSFSGDNALGLQDMAGNVWEWCNDFYGEDYYANSDAIDPFGPETEFSTSLTTSDRAVIRGGSWQMDSNTIRNANRSQSRLHLLFGRTITAIGFRLAKTN